MRIGKAMKAIYEVQIVNRNTGQEHCARVEATSTESARLKVLHLIEAHEIVGDARLSEVVETPEAQPTVQMVTPSIPGVSVIPGVATCPKCAGTNWKGGRGFWVWLLVVLLFPIGLLLLLIKPTWYCTRCQFSYRSYSEPVSILNLPKRRGVLEQIAFAILLAVAILGGLIVLVLLANQR